MHVDLGAHCVPWGHMLPWTYARKRKTEGTEASVMESVGTPSNGLKRYAVMRSIPFVSIRVVGGVNYSFSRREKKLVISRVITFGVPSGAHLGKSKLMHQNN